MLQVLLSAGGVCLFTTDSCNNILVSVSVDVHHGKTTLENCVLQCETTGITVRTSAELLMKNSDLYGAKVQTNSQLRLISQIKIKVSAWK